MTDPTFVVLTGTVEKIVSNRPFDEDINTCTIFLKCVVETEASPFLIRGFSLFIVKAWGAIAVESIKVVRPGDRCLIHGKLVQELRKEDDKNVSYGTVILAEAVEVTHEKS